MSETAQATRFGAREWALARPWLAARWFPLGVGAITVGTAAFLFHQLLAWPPHEDEALPLFVGRHPLDQMFQVVLEERGGAPLHFLLAWAVAHLGLGLEGLRAVSACFAVVSLPIVALLLARLAGRLPALLGTLLVATSWTFLFHGVYGRMYSLFLCTRRPLVPRAAARGRPRRPPGLGALGACGPGHRRDPSLRRARARFAGRVRRGGAARALPRGRVGVRCGRRARDPLLADRPRPRRTLRRGRRRRKPAGRRRVRLAGGGRLQRRVPGAAGRARRRRGRARGAPPRRRGSWPPARRSSRWRPSSSRAAPAPRRRAT